MLEYRQKRKLRKAIYSPFVIVFLIIILGVFIKATWNVYKKSGESQVYLSQAMAQLDKASSTEAGLANSVAALNTREGVETDIRSQFLVAKPGEQVAVIVDNASDTSNGVAGVGGAIVSGDGTTAADAPHGFWVRIWEFFKW